MAFLKQTQLPLEVSPNSNYRLKVVSMDQPHPIRELVDGGVYVTLNSDDPPMFSTDLNNEYITLAGQGFTWDELWRLNLEYPGGQLPARGGEGDLQGGVAGVC